MTQTPALIVRDAIYDRVKAMPFFATFSFSKNKMMRVQTGDLPYCGIYLINELLLPEGDPNAGDIRLRDSARYGFSVIVVDNEGEDGEATLDQALKAITNGLLCDTTLTGFNRQLMQGITRIESTNVYGSVALDNETPVLEKQIDMTVDLGTAIFKPTIVDDFNTFHVDARPIQNPDAPVVEMEWNMQTGEINTLNKRGTNDSRSKSGKGIRDAQPGKRAAASD
jgi:hypothetical protein